MVYLKIAFRNIFRHKRRSWLTIMAVVISVGIITWAVSFISGMNDMVLKNAASSSGHIRLAHPTFIEKERTFPIKYRVHNYRETLEKIRQIPGISSAGGRITFGGMLGKVDIEEIAAGIAFDPSLEPDLFDISESIVEGNLFTSDGNGVVIGSKLANRLKVNCGDTLIVLTRTVYNSLGAMSLIVTGIANFSIDRLNNMIFTALPNAQRAMDMEDSASQIVIKVKRLRDVNPVAEQLRGIFRSRDDLVVKTWRDNEQIAGLVDYMKTAGKIYYFIFMIGAVFGIFNTMFQSVFERTNEIGLLMAMGLTRLKILFVFLSESAGIGLIGTILGLIVGIPVALYFETHGFSMGSNMGLGSGVDFENILYADLNFGNVLEVFLVGWIICILAGLFPAIRATRMEPSSALRQIT